MASLSIDDVSIKSDKLLNLSHIMQNYSTVTVTVATAKNCILRVKNEKGILAQTISSNSITFVPSVAGTFWVEVTTKGSNGATETLSTEGKKTFTVLPYFKPQITEFTCVRDASGNNVTATIKGIVANVEINNSQLNSCGASVTLNGETVALGGGAYTTSEDLRTVNGSVVFENVSSETLTFTAKLLDSLNTVTQEYVLPTEAVTMDFHYSGRGVSFGRVAEEPDLLDVDWKARFRKGIIVDADWVDLVLEDSFVAYGDTDAEKEENKLQCKSMGGVVSVRGALRVADKNATLSTSSNITLATIPEEYRPTKNVRVVCQGSGVNRWLCTVSKNGNIMLSRYGTTDYGNISSDSWLSINITYLI